MRIGEREIGPGHPPFVVAEMAGEHKGSITRAYDLIYAAAEAGADAVKIQVFEPDLLAEARGGHDKVLTEGLWAGRRLGDLYAETHTPKEWVKDLFRYAKQEGIAIFASVFHEVDIEFLEFNVICPAYKISSFELTDLALIRKAASTGKPLIISTGMGSDAEVEKAIDEVIRTSRFPPAVLHCVSAYPCPIEQANLGRIRYMMRSWEAEFGLSDHTLGSVAPVVATALGASIIEKHITLDRKNGGPDAPFSLEPHEFKRMVQDVKDAYASLSGRSPIPSEAPYRELRRKG